MVSWKEYYKRKIALFLAVLMLGLSAISYLPLNLMEAWGFGIRIAADYDPNGAYITGRVEGEHEDTELLCLNKGAPANSTMDYRKTTADVNYWDGTLEQKKLFWAYIGAFGSADGDDSFEKYKYTPTISKNDARRVAWKQQDNAWVNMMANDGFMSLENIPEGCKSPEEIFNLVCRYDAPEKAMSIDAIRSEPGVFSKEKLYKMMGLSGLDALEKYCTISYIVPEGYTVIKTETSTTLHFNIARTDGTLIAIGEAPSFTVKVTYDPAYFKVVKVAGHLEKFTAVSGNRAYEAQVLMRAVGNVEESYPEFYMTTGEGYVPPPGSPGGGGGNRGDTGGISYKIYRHQETFESNYKVDLTKYDYETGLPLKDSTWQVLESFPDQAELTDNESHGNLMEKNMREDPTTWEDWMVFADDMVTDENGFISHSDRRYYDFGHTYCNGHPVPPEPEDSGEGEGDGGGGGGSSGGSGGEEEDDEYGQLMEEWQQQVDGCEAEAEGSAGTMHHWLCDSESEPSEDEAFEMSGCKAARDAAYESFINLRYSYTFRETDARDGYILHGQNGHPDDVPIEVITTTASEAGKEAEWTKGGNEDITVSGYLRNRQDKEDAGTLGGSGKALGHTAPRAASVTASSKAVAKLYLTEHYDLSQGEKAVNALRSFFGLPETFASEHASAVNIIAEDDEPMVLATDSDAGPAEIPLIDDITLATGSDAFGYRSALLPVERRRATGSDMEATSYLYAGRRVSRASLYGAEEEPGLVGYGDGEEDVDRGTGSAILDSQLNVETGPSDRVLHSWKVYDHRVPGQIHFNKRDLDLQAGQSGKYDPYGDSQGDATLEGAVYGLFAADDIYGPDTQRGEDGGIIRGSGIIFDANDLVAVAATDKNGDGSFLAITEKPHSTYNYKTGQVEYSGKAYPGNLYDADTYRKANVNEETGRIYRDNVTANGDWWIGRPLILGNYYIKELTRCEGFELSVTGKDRAVTNATGENRSVYGDTDDAKSHPTGSAWVHSQLKHTVTFPEKLKEFGNRENLFEFAIGSNGATEGYDVMVDGIPEGADIYCNNVELNTVRKQVVTGYEWADAEEEPLYETAQDAAAYKKDAAGKRIKDPDAIETVPRAVHTYGTVAKKLDPDAVAVPVDPFGYRSAFTDEGANVRYVKYELEYMMRQLGMETPRTAIGQYSTAAMPVYDEPGDGAYGSPEVTVVISNVTTNGSVIQAVLDYYQAQRVFTYGSLQEIDLSGDTATVKLAVNMAPDKLAMVETDDGGTPVAGYLFRLNQATGRYIFRKYTGDSFLAMRQVTNGRFEMQMSPDYTVNEAGLPEDVVDFGSELDQYLHYEPGDVLYEYWSEDGSKGYNPVRRKVYRPVYEEQEVTERATSTSQVPAVASREEVADPVGSTYVYFDKTSGQHILHVGTRDGDLGGVKTSWFTVAIPDGSTAVTAEDIERIGKNNVWGIKEGDLLNHSEYIRRITGAGVGVAAAAMFDRDKSFIRNQSLVYSGSHDLCEDGNTKEQPIPVLDRIISQQIKVTKDIDRKSYNNTNSYTDVHEDWWTKLFGGFHGAGRRAAKMDNFRFKTYLKSNLERLYRDEEGRVAWLDRRGNEIDVLAAGAAFPARVNKIYTKVSHRTDPLYQDSADAITAGTELYGYDGEGEDRRISQNQNPGYTAVLETVGRPAGAGPGIRMAKNYNYDKFFDAVAVANQDKWDDAAPTYTSWQPMGNAANRTPEAVENAKASDQVRQFAIDWYLDGEVAKLVREVPANPAEDESLDGQVRYADEVYDKALRQAILKAENYLKPFFAYDLDEIYAIEWDSAEDGGSDRDGTTLSADTLYGDTDDSGDGYYFGTSAYLPYGDYVVVEQQPRYGELGDFKNKHYKVSSPREVTLPAVYADYAGSQAATETMNPYYNYNATAPLPEMERKYKIRFTGEKAADPGHVVRGRNGDGDFEVYKYGMEIGALDNSVPAALGTGDYYALTQDPFRPYKNYYNGEDDRSTGNVPYYLTEGLGGRMAVSKYYRYSSVSEQAGTADGVAYPEETGAEDGTPGIRYKDGVRSMHGVRTAYDGKYAAMLVPWTVAAPENSAAEEGDSQTAASGESSYKGFSYGKFRNRLFTAKLRIEKLDSETHENLLHDGALFNIYAAGRNDSKEGDGGVDFYEKDTVITGTEGFLEAMGADRIQPLTRRLSWIDRLTGREYGPGNLYSGIVPAGTPVCQESEQVILGDGLGIQTVAFQSYSTVLDGQMADEADPEHLAWQNQTVGYLETPQPLGAGTYVICEVKAPDGYTRSRPVALEVYSDKVAYYKEGNRDSRVLAALYESGTGGPVARINVENQPIKLKVEKLKESSADSANTTEDKSVTYKVSGRIDGTLTEIGGNPDYVYAYGNGDYLGYAWRKGTLESLTARKAAGEQVELVYEGNCFAGYGYVTRPLETADDANRYVAGATMALFEGIPLRPSGDTQDHAFDGLVIERNDRNNVTRMYVKEGYGGERVEFVREQDENGHEITTSWQTGVDGQGDPVYKEGNVWTAKSVPRSDTDILYFDLDSLDVISAMEVDGREILCGYDRNYNRVPLDQLESDRRNIQKTDSGHAMFAFKGGIPYLEFTGGDFTKIRYSAQDKVIQVGEGTQVYHLDRGGSRDALVDPYTGMAYVTEKEEAGPGKALVWPVNIRRDIYGNIIARDKITTSRIATVGEGTGEEATGEEATGEEAGYITGSWSSKTGKGSHPEATVVGNREGQNLNEEVLADKDEGEFEKKLNPVYDSHGLPQYYQNSGETYEKNAVLYDRNGEFVRRQDSDNLEKYNGAAYRINREEELHGSDDAAEQQDGQKSLYHRQGEAYILENTWITSDRTPNDPFHDEMTDGQPDVLKRLPAGCYIMEELKAPAGYLKGMPVGVTVRDTPETADTKEPTHAPGTADTQAPAESRQRTAMVDKTTKIVIEKIDGPVSYTYQVLDRNRTDASGNPPVMGTVQENAGAYGYAGVPGAELALYEAKRSYTADFGRCPEGYELVQKGDAPLTWKTTDNTEHVLRESTAVWHSQTAPMYLEGIPAGDYVLKEHSAPEGFVPAVPVPVSVENTPEVQTFTMYNDHTKVEIEKYYAEGSRKLLLSGAEFALYRARTDGQGSVVYEDGKPQYFPDKPLDTWTSSDGEAYREFIPAFEEMYRHYGTTPGTSVIWSGDGKEHWAEYVSAEKSDGAEAGGQQGIFPTRATMVFRTDEGADIRITVYGETVLPGGRDFTFEYQFDYRKLEEAGRYACAYFTVEGRRRLDYLPAEANYVLVETKAPDGFSRAEDMVVQVLPTADVQRYHVEDVEGMLLVSKEAKGRHGEFAGARLGLYRPAEDGTFVRDEAHLLVSWTTGEDGAYTELDEVNGRIPEGYARGDSKPHCIRRLPDGTYWLAELESPDYYTVLEPVRIEYRQEERIQVVRVTDVPVTGTLEVTKTDRGGRSLTGAVFELAAYRKSELHTPVFTRTLMEEPGSVTPGHITVTGLSVGEAGEDGTVIPYRYILKEVVPPDGYAVSPQVISWEFPPDKKGVSYGWGEAAVHKVTVANEKTRVAIEKKDFDRLGEEGGQGVFVKGARLAVYEVTGRDQEDQLAYDESRPNQVWTTNGTEKAHVLEGLIAGRTYLLKELKAPPGYHLMKPVLFTLTSDGRRIGSVSNRLHTVTVNYEDTGVNGKPDGNSIRSLTVRGRYVVRTVRERRFPDENTAETTEIVVYSDGSQAVSGHWVESRVEGQGEKRTGNSPAKAGPGRASDPAPRVAEDVTLWLEHSDGTPIAVLTPREGEEEETVENEISQGQEVFRSGERYILREQTRFSDGSELETGRFAFTLDAEGAIWQVIAANRQTEVILSKKTLTGEEELPGCQMTLTDEKGAVVDSWVSGRDPHVLKGILEPGAVYVLREERPADGYAYASEIRFTVQEDGVADQITMKDKETCVKILKLDAATGRILAGAGFQILDQNGAVVEAWTSGEEPHEIPGILLAGESYVLQEVNAPGGYERMEDMVFTVPADGEVLTVTCENRRSPDRPDHPGPDNPKPDIPLVPKLERIGRVTATYSPVPPRAGGWLYIGEDGKIHVRLPSTGDAGEYGPFGWLAVISLSGIWVLRRRKGK